MPKGTKICKVCGKEYEYCKTWNNNNRFRWQDVACSPECGAIYFEQVEAARNPVKATTAKSSKKKTKKVADPTPIVTDDIKVEEPAIDETTL